MRHGRFGAGIAAAALLAAVAHEGRPARAQSPAPRVIRRSIAFGNVVNGLAVADFNADGKPDVAAAGPEEVAWYERTLGSSFWAKHVIQARTDVTGSVDSICLLTFDMEGDGDLDLIASTPDTGALVWYENPGSAEKPWTRHVIDKLPKIHSEALEDLNRDGRPELVGNMEGALVWFTIPRDPRNLLPASYTGDPAGRGMWERRYLARSGVTGTPHYLNFGDLDGDGDRDLCTGVPDAGYMAWWERPEDGTLIWSKHVLREPFPAASHLFPADIDQDGRRDLFWARGHSTGCGWLSGDGWKEEHVIDEGTLDQPHALILADFDGNDSPDVVAVGRNEGGMAAWINDGHGKFTRFLLDPAQTGMDVKLADLDGDGDRDIVVAGATGKTLAWFENTRL